MYSHCNFERNPSTKNDQRRDRKKYTYEPRGVLQAVCSLSTTQCTLHSFRNVISRQHEVAPYCHPTNPPTIRGIRARLFTCYRRSPAERIASSARERIAHDHASANFARTAGYNAARHTGSRIHTYRIHPPRPPVGEASRRSRAERGKCGWCATGSPNRHHRRFSLAFLASQDSREGARRGGEHAVARTRGWDDREPAPSSRDGAVGLFVRCGHSIANQSSPIASAMSACLENRWSIASWGIRKRFSVTCRAYLRRRGWQWTRCRGADVIEMRVYYVWWIYDVAHAHATSSLCDCNDMQLPVRTNEEKFFGKNFVLFNCHRCTVAIPLWFSRNKGFFEPLIVIWTVNMIFLLTFTHFRCGEKLFLRSYHVTWINALKGLHYSYYICIWIIY